MSIFSNYPLPCLIPSFSSKGTMLRQNDGVMISDNYELISELEKHLYNSYLFSAYDFYYEYMPKDLMQYPIPNILMIDSGGYEISDSYDMSEKYRFNYYAKPWDEMKMMEVYQHVYQHEWCNTANLILATFDSYSSYKEQLEKAYQLMDKFPKATIDFLIKPEPYNMSLQKIMQSINEALPFDLIGFTEKELGVTLKEKLLSIIAIKDHCDQIKWEVNMHIFGGLEPSVLLLFFLAGATVFDGLSWQKVRYYKGSTLHNPERYIVNYQENENKFLMMVENLHELERLELMMRQFMIDRNMKDIRKKLKIILSSIEPLTIYQIFERMEV